MNGRSVVEGEEGGYSKPNYSHQVLWGGKSIENGICKQVTFFVRFLMQVPNWPRVVLSVQRAIETLMMDRRSGRTK